MTALYRLIACLLVSGTCYAGGSLSEVPVDLTHGGEESSLCLDASISEKYKAAAKFLTMGPSNTTETGVVTYETTIYGVNCHIGWYIDGYIGTSLDGTETGKQVVYVNGCVVGISYNPEMRNDHFVHRYTWGAVYSYVNRQIVVFN